MEQKEQKEQEEKLYCPKCGSTQFVANKSGFKAGQAIGGAILTGGIGLMAGFIGSGKVKITCLKCGSVWEPGQLRTRPLPVIDKKNSPWWQKMEEKERLKKEEKRAQNRIIYTICLILFIFIIALFSLL